jgi:hypothetical protein
MKLQYILEAGHWEVAPGDYPNCMTKQKPGRMSMLTDPKDRDRLINWGTSGNKTKKYVRQLKPLKVD